MRCLSLWQPWASLLVHGAKCVETRSWPISHRGPLLIHAAKKWTGELASICKREPFRSVLESLALGADVDCGLPLGVIVGRVDVVECYPTEVVAGDDLNAIPTPYVQGEMLFISEREHAFGDYSPGRFAFLCKNPVAFPNPIPYRGAQGLFDVSTTLLPKDL
jgi:hypothetical protein